MHDRDEAFARLLGLTGPLFVVLDGAQFVDLPDDLVRSDLRASSLYKERGRDGSADYERTAPRLLSVSAQYDWKNEVMGVEEALRTVLRLIDKRPAAVFWECSAGEHSLYRHLRSMNEVLYPKETRLQPASFDLAENVSSVPLERVLFRHADANALVQVATALRPDQVARLLGPAARLLCWPDAEWSSDVNFELEPTASVEPSRGTLTIDVDTAERIAAERLTGRTVRYLRETNPQLTAGMAASELRRRVASWSADGHDRGMRTERAVWKWNYLNLLTRGGIAERSDVAAYLVDDDPTWPIDDRVDDLMSGAVAELREVAR